MPESVAEEALRCLGVRALLTHQQSSAKENLTMFRFIKSLTIMLVLITGRVGLAQTITVPVDYWDFLYSGTTSGTYGGYSGVGHPDFQSYGCGVTTGLVQSTLGSNGLPAFGPNGSSCLTSSASFAQGYQTTPGINVYVPGVLTLTNIGSNTYQYSSTQFYPIDGQGFNAAGFQGDLDCSGSGPHNFSFTTHLEFSGQFTSNSQSLTLTGNDDIWVFINGRLVIDLGGVHGSSTGSISASFLASQ